MKEIEQKENADVKKKKMKEKQKERENVAVHEGVHPHLSVGRRHKTPPTTCSNNKRVFPLVKTEIKFFSGRKYRTLKRS